MDAEIQQDVTTRRVIYIPGYDPFHPRRYRELYRKEGKAQAEISGYDIEVAARPGTQTFGWTAKTQINGITTEAEIEVLVWSDIVQASMAQSIPATYWQLLRTAWAYIASGALFRLMRLRKGPVIAALYPIVFLLAQLALAVTVAIGAGILAHVLAPTQMIGLIGGTLVSALVFWGILDLFKRHDNKFYAYYLMHDFAFSARWGGANPPELEARMAQFGDQIAEALRSDVDEVLVVGHSSGAHLAVSILADLERAGRVPEHGAKLAFLSLGHVVPMVSFLPKASRLRRDLHDLSQSQRIFWADVTAPGDGCSFALCDPVAVTGVAPADQTGPLVFSAAFTRSLSPVRWRALRWRFFRLHFQYLCAFDAPQDYDYFQITAGGWSLVRRYRGRPASASRLVTPVNKYTSMDPAP